MYYKLNDNCILNLDSFIYIRKDKIGKTFHIKFYIDNIKCLDIEYATEDEMNEEYLCMNKYINSMEGSR